MLQPAARFRDLGEELFVFWQKVVDLAGADIGTVWVFKVEVVVPGLDLSDDNAPSLLIFYAAVPPRSFRLEFLDADGFTLVIALRTSWIRVLVIPDFSRGLALGEEEEVDVDLLALR